MNIFEAIDRGKHKAYMLVANRNYEPFDIDLAVAELQVLGWTSEDCPLGSNWKAPERYARMLEEGTLDKILKTANEMIPPEKTRRITGVIRACWVQKCIQNLIDRLIHQGTGEG